MFAPRPILQDEPESNADDGIDSDRERRADFLRSAVACIAWAACGIFGVAWSVHTTDLTLGRVAFFGGLGVANGGVIFTLLAAYRRGERRGDW